MIPITTYIDISVTRTSTGISRQGFGTPLILAPVSQFYDRTKEYSLLSDVAEDFLSSTDIYKKAQAVFGQNPRPRTLKVGRKYADVNAKQEFIPDAVPTAGTFTITLGAETTGAIAYNAANTAIKSALEALTAITAVTVTGDLTAITGFTVEFTGTDANTHFATMSASAAGLTTCSAINVSVLQYGSADEDYTDAIDAICVFDDDWYGLCCTDKTDAVIAEIAANIEARRKLYIALSNDATIPTSGSGDVATVLKTAGYTRTALVYTSDLDNDTDAAWLGKMLPYDPGSATWAYKNLAGEAVDTYTTSERSYAIGKYANIFLEVASARIIEQGKTAGNEYLDVMIGVDWIEARLRENIFQALVDADKIPYTDAGSGIIVGIIKATLREAYKKNIITEDFTVYCPAVADVSTTDRANRIFPDISFEATLQGAIHYLTVSGTVSV